MKDKIKKLNIACGVKYHKDWINIDFHAESNDVRKVNILKGLPFEDSSIDVVYTSHFLEHLTQEQANFVLQESKRVLKNNGIIRIVVPDLENICKEYIKILELVNKNEEYENLYNWITIELLDQLVRVNSGGKMAEMLSKVASSGDKKLAEYILIRTGDDVLKKSEVRKKKITLNKLKNKFLYFYLKMIMLLISKNLRDLVFVNTSIGERHQWMYDRFSLSGKLSNLGFLDIEVKSHNTSNIPNFNDYLLDIKEDGSPYKGVSSLYIEARK